MFNGRLSPKVLVNGLLVLLIVAILLGRKFACLPGMNMDQGDIGQWAEQEITVVGELVNAPAIRIDDAGKRHIKYVIASNQVLVGGKWTDTHGKIILYCKKRKERQKNNWWWSGATVGCSCN